MEKSKLLPILFSLEGWFYLMALATTFSLWRISNRLNMPIMLPYKPLFRRLAFAFSTLVFAGLMLIVFLLNKTLWEVLILAEIGIAASLTYFVFKLPSAWREIIHSSHINELRFLESNKFKAIFDNSPDAIISANSKGQIIDWNRAAEIIFGWKEEEIIGKNLTMIMPERYRAMHEKGMKRFLDTGEKKLIGKTIQIEGLRNTNDEFKMEISLFTYGTRNDVRFTAIIREVTKRD